MSVPRLRMLAGPNGSGKSTLFDFLASLSFPLGHCLNPDRLEREVATANRLDFRPHGLLVDDPTFRAFVTAHGLASRLQSLEFAVHANMLETTGDIRGGYFAAILSDFLRRQWLESAQSFTFETVMSGRDKVQLLQDARARGYRTYLYYICTDSPLINHERVANRVSLGGHAVPADKIDARYTRSLALLPAATQNASRAYLFDNSTKHHRLIAEFEEGNLIAASEQLPGWFVNTGLLTAPHSDPDTSQ
jgi:predicted ABC-type ATPase